MKKYPIGFNIRINKEPEINVPMEVCKGVFMNTSMNKKISGKISLGV